jgi:prepilin-type processing-associated H-X9-DG protein
MFGNDGATTMGGITDGTSTTIAVGEASGGRHKWDPAYGPWGLCGTHTCCHGRVLSVSSTTTLTYLPTDERDWHINAPWQANLNGQSYAWVFNSLHPGGANFVLADGSTRFLNQSMDYGTFCALNYTHDATPVGNF